MAGERAKNLVAAASLLGAAALGAFLGARALGLFDPGWSDGTRRFGAETGPLVRHAVWDRPEDFAALGPAQDPAVSPDGRWLVFASGERGLNVELYLAELVDGRPRGPRPLVELASPADEFAPAFTAEALYFASDRAGGAGGLDLWRAPYDDGLFGRPAPLGPGLNSAADETDPAPLEEGGALAFASNRARADFDLYLAQPDADGFFQVEPLGALNSPGEERAPAFASEGRSLYFSSDRGGAARIQRSLRAAAGLGPPRAVAELAALEASESGPAPSRDGFELWFARTDEEGASRLLRARSLELFPVPPPAVTLAQWLTLGALVLLGLLALLSQRWRALDILYRCLLVSLLLHLLLMYGLRRLFPPETRYESGQEQGPSFRVRLAPSAPAKASSGLSATESPSRAPFGAELAQLTASTTELVAPRHTEEAGPAARDLARPTPAASEVVLALPRETLARSAGEAPALVLEAAASAPRTTARAPEAAHAGLQARLAPAPAEPSTEPRTAASEVATGPARGAHVPALAAAPAPELARPNETLLRASGAAPQLALEPASISSTAQAATPERAPAPARVAARGLVPEPARMEEPTTGSPAADPTPAREPLRPRATHHEASTEDGPALRQPEIVAAQPRGTTAVFEPTQGLGAEPGAPPSPGFELPIRAQSARAPNSGLEPAPLVANAAAVPLPAAPRRDVGGGELRSADPSPALALRAPASSPAASATPASPRFEATDGLWRGTEPEREAPAAPRRAELARAAPRRTEPAPAALSAQPPPALAEPIEVAPRLAETPYKNRFGAQKLRALEEHGGSAQTEAAVAAGLAYLARIQGTDGAFGQRSDAHAKYLDVRIGKSALALLAFLGAGHVPGGATEHAENAARTVAFLLREQDERSGHFGRSCSYGHGIATYALAECFALTGDARLRAPLERALRQVLAHQSTVPDARFRGGWGYYFADGHVWNRDEWPRASITAWQVMALESARLGGLSVPDEAFEAARAFLLGAWDPRARAFRYSHDPQRLGSGYPILPASTPAALFALDLLGVDVTSAELAAARRFVLVRAPDGYRYTGDDDFVQRARGNPYFWYYATLALFRVGGSEWARWNRALQETLLPAQDRDGSWRPLDTYAEYAGDEDDERTYATAMCVLSLEVYYRYFTPLLRVR
jgi:hypothetical protein